MRDDERVRLDPNHIAIVAAFLYPTVRATTPLERANAAVECAWDLLQASARKMRAIEEQLERDRADGEVPR